MVENSNEERVKLDEILKSLFTVSQKVLIQMLNSLFNENFKVDLTEVTFANNEFVSDEYDIIRGDLFLKISKEEKPYHYHIELQTKNDAAMVIRMFEYGFGKAKELSKYKKAEETVIYIPKQLVIFIEQNRNIKDILKMKLIFPDGQEVKYRVPVVKYWEYDEEKIIEEKMYPLLPLQIFKLRYKMERIKNKGINNDLKLQKAVLEAKQTAESIAKTAKDLYDQDKIYGEDLHKVLLAINNLFEYLNRKYGNNEQLEKEVFAMTKTLYDPVIEKKGEKKGEEKGKIEGKIEVAKNMILLGIDIDKIKKATKLPQEEIEKLIKQNKC